MAEKFNPVDYRDGGNKKFDGKDYSGLKGMDAKKILAIADARVGVKAKEAADRNNDQVSAASVINAINTPAAKPITLTTTPATYIQDLMRSAQLATPTDSSNLWKVQHN
jgi:hypothetical protein